MHQWIARMGQPLYGFQTPNGYADVAENWVNTGALLERMNFALALVSNRIPGTRVDLSRFLGDFANHKSVDKEKLLNRFITLNFKAKGQRSKAEDQSDCEDDNYE